MSSIDQNLDKSLNVNSQYMGMHDVYNDFKLRIGVIDDPYVSDRYSNQDSLEDIPIDQSGAINFKTGRVAIRWLDTYGGVKLDNSLFNDANSNEASNSNTDTNNNSNDYGSEIIQVAYPSMWSSNNLNHWCGYLSIPCAGSVVVVGFRGKNIPIILGCLNADWDVVAKQLIPLETYRNDTIKQGEQVLKGYGDNFIYLKQVEEMSLGCTKEKGNKNIEGTVHQNTIHTNITLSPLNENIIINLDDDTGQHKALITLSNSYIDIQRSSGSTSNISGCTIYDDKVYIASKGSSSSSSFVITPDSIQIDTPELIINGANATTLTTNNLTINSNTYTLNSQIINQNATSAVNINLTNELNNGTLKITANNTSINSNILLLNGEEY